MRCPGNFEAYRAGDLEVRWSCGETWASALGRSGGREPVGDGQGLGPTQTKLRLEFLGFDAAVLLAAGVAVVGRDRFFVAVTFGDDAAAVDAVGDQVFAAGLGAVF